MTFFWHLCAWVMLASSLLANVAWAEEGPEPAKLEPATVPLVPSTAPPELAEPPSAISPPTRRASAQSSDGSQAGRVVGYVAMGVGGAALLTGGVFGVLALRDEARLSARCPKDTCTPDRQSELDSYESKKLVSGIGLISGVALGAGGALLFVLSSGSGSPDVARGGLYFAGREAGVWGAF